MAGELYITPSELTLYYDSRRVLDLAVDTGTRADIADLSNAGSNAYKRVNAMIASVCSEIDSVCQQGKRYVRADLEAMIAASGSDDASTKRAASLKQMTADLVFGRLMAVRGYGADQQRQLAPRYEKAEQMLEMLYQGSRVFDFDDNIKAGVPDTLKIGLNLLKWSEFNRMFGVFPTNPFDSSWRCR